MPFFSRAQFGEDAVNVVTRFARQSSSRIGFGFIGQVSHQFQRSANARQTAPGALDFPVELLQNLLVGQMTAISG
jgi:hypothetical protein